MEVIFFFYVVLDIELFIAPYNFIEFDGDSGTPKRHSRAPAGAVAIMPGIAASPSKRETLTEPHISSEMGNVPAVLEKFPPQPVKLPLFNPSSDKIFNGTERHTPHNDGRIEDIQNWNNELQNNFASLSIHLEVIEEGFFCVCWLSS